MTPRGTSATGKRGAGLEGGPGVRSWVRVSVWSGRGGDRGAHCGGRGGGPCSPRSLSGVTELTPATLPSNTRSRGPGTRETFSLCPEGCVPGSHDREVRNPGDGGRKERLAGGV